MAFRHGEERFYVGKNSAGILGVSEIKDPFVTNTGKRWVWVVVIIVLFILTMIVGVRFNKELKDRYMEQSAFDTPAEAATREIGKTMVSLYARESEIIEFYEDEDETARALSRYIGSEKAAELGWSGDDLAGHFTVYYTELMARYDTSKSVMKDGRSRMYIYLIQDAGSGQWQAVGTAVAPEETVS